MRQLIVYTTPSCAPCAALKPMLIELQKAHGFDMRVVELSTATRDFFVSSGVRSAPTVACVEEGKTLGLFVGLPKDVSELMDHLVEWKLIGDKEKNV